MAEVPRLCATCAYYHPSPDPAAQEMLFCENPNSSHSEDIMPPTGTCAGWEARYLWEKEPGITRATWVRFTVQDGEAHFCLPAVSMLSSEDRYAKVWLSGHPEAAKVCPPTPPTLALPADVPFCRACLDWLKEKTDRALTELAFLVELRGKLEDCRHA